VCVCVCVRERERESVCYPEALKMRKPWSTMGLLRHGVGNCALCTVKLEILFRG